jgi:hypothetical protein
MSVRTGGQWDTFVAQRATTSSPFSTPSNSIFANLNSPFTTEFEANLSADELQIFFTSNRPGGIGSSDIWWASRPDTTSAFGAPVNVTSINSVNQDRSPVLFGNTLFLASARASSVDDEQATDIYQVQIVSTIDSLIDAVSKAVADGTLTGTGPTAPSQNGRLHAWVNMLNSSQRMIESGNLVGACDELRDAYGFIDGVSPPPDLVTGSAAPALAAQIQAVRRELGCF